MCLYCITCTQVYRAYIMKGHPLLGCVVFTQFSTWYHKSGPLPLPCRAPTLFRCPSHRSRDPPIGVTPSLLHPYPRAPATPPAAPLLRAGTPAPPVPPPVALLILHLQSCRPPPPHPWRLEPPPPFLCGCISRRPLPPPLRHDRCQFSRPHNIGSAELQLQQVVVLLQGNVWQVRASSPHRRHCSSSPH